MKRFLVFAFGLLLGLAGGDNPVNAAWFQSTSPSPTHQEQTSDFEKGLGPSVQRKGAEQVRWSIDERMKHYRVPGVSIAIVNEGKICWAKGYGIANTDTQTAVQPDTLFQAGSISKPIAALAALKLVEEGRIDLDKDVNHYLKSWKVPENEFTKAEKVTLRRLLSHTAGMTVHGFPGYTQTDEFPTTVQVLDGKGNTAPIRVNTVPGTTWRYSGGGYTVMQQLVEDVSGVSFTEYLNENILKPVGMTQSTYQQPLPQAKHANASAAYNRFGKIVKGHWHNYPEQAAAGLWTTPSDLAVYCMEIQRIVSGEKTGILSQDIVQKMLTKHQGNWGLGPSLDGDDDELVFEHGGKNAGFSNDMFAYAHRGQAAIVMTSGDNGTQLAGEIMRAIADQYQWRGQTEWIEPVELNQDQLGKFSGEYKLTMNGRTLKVRIEVEKDGLRVTIPAQLAIKQFTAIGETRFVDLSDGTKVEFTQDQDGSVDGFTLNGQARFIKSGSGTKSNSDRN